MSVKHVKLYYEKVCQQRQEMIAELKDFEEEANKGVFPPERLDEIKKSIQPLMTNYQFWSYVMYLLNQPNKKSKQNRYRTQNAELLARAGNNTADKMLEDNTKTLATIGGTIKNYNSKGDTSE